MMFLLEFLFVLLLFLVGIRLSALFSGSETGFYRVSFPRISIDAQGGDPTAQWLLWLAHNPAYFVATTLIGNNLANYVTTFAIGWGAVLLAGAGAASVEIAATLLLSPIIFLFGELLPKNLYYRSPLRLLRRDVRWFRGFYYLFIPMSWPLVGLTQLLERFGPQSNKTSEAVLGRSRLVQYMNQGHSEGVLNDIQSRLSSSLLQIAAQPVAGAVMPAARVLSVSSHTSREEVLAQCQRFGVSAIVVHSEESQSDWLGYVRVADLSVDTRSVPSLLRPLPELDATTSKLEALRLLRTTEADFGLVRRGAAVEGIISERGLAEQFFRTSPIAHDTRQT